MADRQDSDREVLTSLPRSRPVRRSAKRGERAEAKPAGSAGSRRPPTSKPRAPKAATKAKAKPKPSAPAKPKAAPRTAPRAAPSSTERPHTAPRRKIPPAGYAAPTARADDASSGTTDLLSTTIQAAAELAQIGLTVGRQTLQSMLDRLPKP